MAVGVGGDGRCSTASTRRTHRATTQHQLGPTARLRRRAPLITRARITLIPQPSPRQDGTYALVVLDTRNAGSDRVEECSSAVVICTAISGRRAAASSGRLLIEVAQLVGVGDRAHRLYVAVGDVDHDDGDQLAGGV
jgi:hypothetical protein